MGHVERRYHSNLEELEFAIEKHADLFTLTANLATYVCRLQVMACGQPGLLYPRPRGAKNACGKPIWIRLGGIPRITSVGLRHSMQNAAGWPAWLRNH